MSEVISLFGIGIVVLQMGTTVAQVTFQYIRATSPNTDPFEEGEEYELPGYHEDDAIPKPPPIYPPA